MEGDDAAAHTLYTWKRESAFLHRAHLAGPAGASPMMKRIGLLTVGETGTAVLYCHLLHEEIRVRTRGRHSVRLLSESLDMAGFPQRAVAPETQRELIEAAQRLERHGAHALLLGSSFLHLQAGPIQAALGIPLLRTEQATAEKLSRLQLTPAALVGLDGSECGQRLWESSLAAGGIGVIYPKKIDASFVTDQLAKGLTPETAPDLIRAAFTRLSVDLKLAGARIIVLTRPELAYGLREEDSVLPTLCAVHAHCEMAARFALGETTGAAQLREGSKVAGQ